MSEEDKQSSKGDIDERKEDPTGIEPVTQGTAVLCSTAELRIPPMNRIESST